MASARFTGDGQPSNVRLLAQLMVASRPAVKAASCSPAFAARDKTTITNGRIARHIIEQER
jgi:hypothetical protein